MKLSTLWALLVLLLAGSLAAAGELPASTQHGIANAPGAGPVPRALLPPGAADADPGPSDVIFPAQRVPLRFSHARHLSAIVGATCATCHPRAATSQSVRDRLVPTGPVCDGCHGVDHPSAQGGGPLHPGGCNVCHLGAARSSSRAGAASAWNVSPVEMPRANLIFSHGAHAARNIGCAQCHGAVDKIELATRDQLPRMQGCLACHAMPDPASRGDAKSACVTCHLPGGSEGTRIRTMFASGTLLPPPWFHNAAHTPDFVVTHKSVAGDDSSFCASCHTEDFCADCHDGRVRPRQIHPNDYLNMHAVEARMQTQRCASCHREQSFCIDCHLRIGVSEDSPSGVREGARFHPPKSVWSDSPRGPGHHAFEAERNLNACVSCHTERDCVACHGALGVGGGVDPHPAGFVTGCSGAFHRNPRPCFVCHGEADAVLARCR